MSSPKEVGALYSRLSFSLMRSVRRAVNDHIEDGASQAASTASVPGTRKASGGGIDSLQLRLFLYPLFMVVDGLEKGLVQMSRASSATLTGGGSWGCELERSDAHVRLATAPAFA